MSYQPADSPDDALPPSSRLGPLDGPLARLAGLPGPPLDVADLRMQRDVLGLADEVAVRARAIVDSLESRVADQLEPRRAPAVDPTELGLAVAGGLCVLVCDVAFRRLADDVADWMTREFIYATCSRMTTALRERGMARGAEQDDDAAGATAARGVRAPVTMSAVHDEIIEQLSGAEMLPQEHEGDPRLFDLTVRRAFIVGPGLTPAAYARLDLATRRAELRAMLAGTAFHDMVVERIERIGAAAG